MGSNKLGQCKFYFNVCLSNYLSDNVLCNQPATIEITFHGKNIGVCQEHYDYLCDYWEKYPVEDSYREYVKTQGAHD